MEEYLKNAKTRLNPPWERKAKWFLLGAFALTVCYKLWLTPTYFAFGFAEALALVLALFAVWLSLQFYYKAGEQNAQNQDRIFQFMKEASLVLGRLDAAVGGRTTAAMPDQQRLVKFAADRESIAVKQEELERARAEQAAVTADKDKIILDLLARANLRGADAQKYFNLLAGKEQLLHDLARRQSLLEQQLLDAGLEDLPGFTPGSPVRTIGKKIG